MQNAGARVAPKSEIADAVGRSARFGEGIQRVARRHGLTHAEVFGLSVLFAVGFVGNWIAGWLS